MLAATRQQVHVVMRPDHPLADRPTIRLGACAPYPIALPTARYGVRDLLDLALHLGQLRGHALPVVAAKFAGQLERVQVERSGD